MEQTDNRARTAIFHEGIAATIALNNIHFKSNEEGVQLIPLEKWHDNKSKSSVLLTRAVFNNELMGRIMNKSVSCVYEKKGICMDGPDMMYIVDGETSRTLGVVYHPMAVMPPALELYTVQVEKENTNRNNVLWTNITDDDTLRKTVYSVWTDNWHPGKWKREIFTDGYHIFI